MPTRFELLLEQLPPLQSKATFQIDQAKISAQDVSSTCKNEIPDNCFYSIGFARRFMYPDVFKRIGISRIDIAHSAVYLQPVDVNNYGQANGQPIIIGRLPPFFSKKKSTTKNPIATEMSNEKDFWFLSWRPFDVVMPVDLDSIIVSGAEIKAVLNYVNSHVCSDQIGDMLHSNCYSATMILFSQLAVILARRMVRNQQEHELVVAGLRGILGIIHRFVNNHYGIGVSNNTLVLTNIEQAVGIVRAVGYGYILNERGARPLLCAYKK